MAKLYGGLRFETIGPPLMSSQIVRLVIFALGIIFVTGEPAASNEVCKGSTTVAGECFTVHGRIEEGNGIPFRLWIVGTHRVLAPNGVPDKVSEYFEFGWKNGTPMSVAVYGDFEVCPPEKERPGWMRSVCIKRASHLYAQTWDGTPIGRSN
jgi:hypothetical protein